MCFLQIILELQPYVNCQVGGKSRGYQHQNAPKRFFLYTIYSYIGDRVPDFNSLCNVIIYFKKQKVRKKVKSMPELMKQTQPSDL